MSVTVAAAMIFLVSPIVALIVRLLRSILPVLQRDRVVGLIDDVVNVVVVLP